MNRAIRTLVLLTTIVGATVVLAGPASAATLQDLVGDMDNFGYGVGNSVPCSHFDNGEPEDLNVFDVSISGDEPRSWTHEYAIPAGATVASVDIEIREIFADVGGADEIVIDGNVIPFPGNADCATGPVVRVFEFDGTDAAFAADGEISIQFFENGDDIALDYSLVTIEFSGGGNGATTGLTVKPNGAGPGRSSVSVTVANVGQSTFTAPVVVTVSAPSGGSAWSSSPQSVTLRPGERRTLYFTAQKPSGPASSTYTTKACINAPNDPQPSNNCLSRSDAW